METRQYRSPRPSDRIVVTYGSRISQLAITVLAKPNMVTNLKLRWTGHNQSQKPIHCTGLLDFVQSNREGTYTKDLLLAENAHVSLVVGRTSVLCGHRAGLIEVLLPILIEAIVLGLLSQGDNGRLFLCRIHVGSLWTGKGRRHRESCKQNSKE